MEPHTYAKLFYTGRHKEAPTWLNNLELLIHQEGGITATKSHITNTTTHTFHYQGTIINYTLTKEEDTYQTRITITGNKKGQKNLQTILTQIGIPNQTP